MTKDQTLNKMIWVCFALLGLLALLITLNQHKGEDTVAFYSNAASKIIEVNAINLGNTSTGAAPVTTMKLLGLSQRDRAQYNSDEEWRTWSPSSCSATSIAAILSGYGKAVKTSDVLAIMRSKNAISANAGLFDYSVFDTIAANYGMKATLNQSHDLDSHFNNILTQVKAGTPMLVNVQDAVYFPSGHFVVAANYNPATNKMVIINPDPARGMDVVQEWPLDAFKTYFSRSLRSVAFQQIR